MVDVHDVRGLFGYHDLSRMFSVRMLIVISCKETPIKICQRAFVHTLPRLVLSSTV